MDSGIIGWSSEIAPDSSQTPQQHSLDVTTDAEIDQATDDYYHTKPTENAPKNRNPVKLPFPLILVIEKEQAQICKNGRFHDI